MKYLKIQNKGLLDVRLISLMGGTTKSEDQFKIGQFGSGLKYVLAYMFRNEIDFKIFVGHKEIQLDLRTETIANTDFDIIEVEGEKTSITTSMGKDWDAWMIVRELYSNALDEGEAVYKITDTLESEDDVTAFYIQLTPQFLDVYNNWSKYFIVGNEPMYENDKYAFHPRSGKLRLYKQGIFIHEDHYRESIFDIDIKDASINELREYTGYLEGDLKRAILSIDDKETLTYMVDELVNNEATRSVSHNDYKSKIEGDLDYTSSYGNIKEVWTEVIGNSKIIDYKTKERLISNDPKLEVEDILVLPEALFRFLSKKFERMSAVRVSSELGSFFEIIDEGLDQKIKECITVLETAGYFIDPELSIKFGEFGKSNVYAQVNIDAKEIFISSKMKEKSMFDTCAMLIEENEHYKTAMSDCSRGFQQHFINLYTKTLFDKENIKL